VTYFFAAFLFELRQATIGVRADVRISTAKLPLEQHPQSPNLRAAVVLFAEARCKLISLHIQSPNCPLDFDLSAIGSVPLRFCKQHSNHRSPRSSLR
jgi:hypothetical protein